MTDQKIDARVPSDTSKTGPHTTGDSGNQAAHARRSAEECFDRGLQYDDAGNHVNALEWYRKAADQGYAVAQVILGWHYHTGEGVPQDDAEAARWYRLAADQGDAVAQQSLGCAYREGNGVPQDDAESVRWFRLAAEQGRADAQHDLACSYRDGNGVPQDYVQAHMWYSLSASQSSEAEWANRAKNRDLTAQRMTPAQLAEAQRLAREWGAARPPHAGARRAVQRD